VFDKSTESRVIAIDVNDIIDTPRGARVRNALLSSKGVLYRTKRGRLAIQIRPEIFAKLQPQLNIELEEGLDGTRDIKFL
jgi:hypothetical protein